MSFVKRINSIYSTMDDVKNLLAYCENSKNYFRYQCFGTNPLNMDYIISSMMRVKRIYHKEEGNQVHHLVLGFQVNKKMAENRKLFYAEDVLYTLGNYLNDKGFQSVGYIHKKENRYVFGYTTDVFENVHIHLIINSVNGYTGLKLTNVQTFLKDILSELRREYPNLNWDRVIYK